MKTALVVGVSRGIGRGISKVLAMEGFKVIMMARNEKRLEEIKAEFAGYDLVVETCCADITDRKAINEKICGIIEEYGTIDVLVNGAGLMPFPMEIVDTPDKLWDDMVNVNLTGTFNVTKAVLPYMIKKGYGRIINISSVSARKTVAMFVGYAAAKGALHAFTTALANEVSSKGITVNCVLPGFTETEEMHRIWGSVAKQSGTTEDALLAPFWQQIPLGRWIQPEEIAHTVSFLASDKANVVTGQIIKVDGGYDNHD